MVRGKVTFAYYLTNTRLNLNEHVILFPACHIGFAQFTWTEWVIPLSKSVEQGIVPADVDRIALGLGTINPTNTLTRKAPILFFGARPPKKAQRQIKKVLPNAARSSRVALHRKKNALVVGFLWWFIAPLVHFVTWLHIEISCPFC